MMKRFLGAMMAAVVCLAAAATAPAAALVTQGSSEFEVEGMCDFASAVGTDLSLTVGYAYFFWDRISLGGRAGFADNDAVTQFSAGLTGEYNFRLSSNYRAVIGTDFVPFVGGAVDYRYVDIYSDSHGALVFGTEGGVKFFLTDSAAVTASLLGELATAKIYADGSDTQNYDLSLRLGMRFYF